MDPLLLGKGLPEGARKELYSLAYMSTIAAAASCEVFPSKMDYDSIDAWVTSSKGRRPMIAVQLKATASECIVQDEVIHDLPIKNYDDLRTSERIIPVALILLHLPILEEKWVTHQENLLALRNNAYYYNLYGMPDVPNTTTVRIKIPISQRLTKESLLMLLDHFSHHGRLP